jgi:hypothetical protein
MARSPRARLDTRGSLGRSVRGVASGAGVRKRSRLRIVLLLLPALFVLAACGGSGKSSATSGPVSVETATTPIRTATYADFSPTMEPTIRCGRGGMKGCTGVANDRVVVEEPAPSISRLDIIMFP